MQSSRLPPAYIGTAFLGPFAWALRPAKKPRQVGTLRPDVPSALKTIARVVAYAEPYYAIDLVGIETAEGHRCYHLRLRPLSSPETHNLRDLWVDVATFDLWKVHYVGEYAPSRSAMESQSDVTVLFTPAAEYWVVRRVVWTYDSIDESADYVFDASTDRITFASALPNWLFNARAYERHEKAKAPDFLAQVMKAALPSPEKAPPPEAVKPALLDGHAPPTVQRKTPRYYHKPS